ncbi:PREDICTED: protein Dok-7 [Miniopterus natalensis]|uniref:protein Dok-7 n=1 Tax=Miniopterus natalensis TaxID=291302 RepID=UPI0007A6D264|nr:PREDICTED: protein Dok-7 [Miniopterus natalensis]
MAECQPPGVADVTDVLVATAPSRHPAPRQLSEASAWGLRYCLLMLAYKDRAERAKGLRERSSLMLEDICGLEPGLPYEGLAHTLAIVCLSQAVMLGFDSREAMCAWDARIRYALGEVHRFHVTVAPGTKLESGPATLHLCNDVLVVARDVPPAVAGQWKLSDLRRYGAVPNGFIFEGGTRCGYWAGVFFLSSAEGEQISFLFDCIVRGISPTKGPFGLRPVLPGVWGQGAAASAPGLPTHPGAPGPEGPCIEVTTYMNVPASPSSKKQLYYLGLELPEARAGVQGASASHYAQIDLEATAAAHRVGAQHAQAREERLAELEPRRKGAPR